MSRVVIGAGDKPTPTIPQMLERRMRETDDYKAMMLLDRAIRFLTCFVLALFVISLLARFVFGVVL